MPIPIFVISQEIWTQKAAEIRETNITRKRHTAAKMATTLTSAMRFGENETVTPNNVNQEFAEAFSSILKVNAITLYKFDTMGTINRRTARRWKEGECLPESEKLLWETLKQLGISPEESENLVDIYIRSRNLRGTVPALTSVERKGFKTMLAPLDFESVPMQTDPIVSAALSSRVPPSSWLGRLKYVDYHGARNWTALDSERRNVTNLQVGRICANCLEEIGNRTYTFVSFGPGNGQLDKNLVLELKPKNWNVEYIPIDISNTLLGMTWSIIKDHVQVPILICGDFEEGLPFVLRTVASYGKGPFFYSLLGNTFGNFEENLENQFINELCSNMKKDDILLLHITTYTQAYVLEKDHRWSTALLDHARRRFYAYGIARKLGMLDFSNFQEIYDKLPADIEALPGESAVPNTQSVAIHSKQLDQNIQIFHRYELNSLIRWFGEKGMEVISSQEDDLEFAPMLKNAVIVLRRSGNYLL